MISFLFLETGSYIFTKHDINFQIISSFSPTYILEQHIDYLIYFLIIVIFLWFLISVKTSLINISLNYKFKFKLIFLLYADIIIFYYLILIFRKSLYPFSDITFKDHYYLKLFISMPAITKLRKDYDQLFSSSKIRENQASLLNSNNKRNLVSSEQLQDLINYNKTSNNIIKPKRNLIIIEMESIELQSLGLFNPKYPTMAPFLNNFSQQGTFFENFVKQPFTLWTSGSIFCSQCGLPHVISDQIWETMQKTSISKWPNLPCFAKHFLNVGYNLYISSAGSIVMMGISDFFKQLGYKLEDGYVHHKYHDYGFFMYIIEKIFHKKIEEKSDYSKLIKYQINEPFVYIINNQDTHPFFYIDKRCPVNPKLERIENAINCYDHLLKLFFDAFEKSEFFNRTDVLLYGDHPSIGNVKMFYKEPRKMLMFFPYLEKRVIHKQVTLYDIAPTILDMMGLEYFPPFPYGSNLFEEETPGTFPVNDEFNYIYNSVLKESNKKLNCLINNTCDDVFEYYKTRQMNLTESKPSKSRRRRRRK